MFRKKTVPRIDLSLTKLLSAQATRVELAFQVPSLEQASQSEIDNYKKVKLYEILKANFTKEFDIMLGTIRHDLNAILQVKARVDNYYQNLYSAFTSLAIDLVFSFPIAANKIFEARIDTAMNDLKQYKSSVPQEDPG